MDDLSLTEEQVRILDELELQSSFYDMAIDWESLELVPKRDNSKPEWLERWLDKQNNEDNNPASPDQAWA